MTWVGTPSPGDDVLRWISEVGAGSWVQLRDAIAFSTAVRRVAVVRPWQMASDLSALGHVDIDWDCGRWSIAPPCLVLAPEMGLCAYLAGWRTKSLLERFDEAADTLDTLPFDVEQGSAPRARFVKCASVEALERVAAHLEIPVVYDPSSQLAEATSVHTGRALAAPPPPDEDLDLFDSTNVEWVRVDLPEGPGLYRYELHGRRVFRLLADDWYAVDRAAGQLAILHGRRDVLRWHPSDRENTTPRCASVRRDVSLPALAERALVSSSGLLPRRSGEARTYLNVDPTVADTLGRQLGVETSFEEKPVKNWKPEL